jgi:hypothetical protein
VQPKLFLDMVQANLSVQSGSGRFDLPLSRAVLQGFRLVLGLDSFYLE